MTPARIRKGTTLATAVAALKAQHPRSWRSLSFTSKGMLLTLIDKRSREAVEYRFVNSKFVAARVV